MTFHPEHVPAFLDLFGRTADQIRAFPGCHHLELLRAEGDTPQASGVRFATHSHWTDAAALDVYRHSDLFRTTWAATKVLFAERAVATSFTIVWPQEDASLPEAPPLS